MSTQKPAAPATTKPATAPATAAVKKERKPRVAVPSDENKGQRFARIAKSRLTKVVGQLRRLETVGRSPAYEYTPDQANKLMAYVDEAVERVRGAFVARVNKKPEDSISL